MLLSSYSSTVTFDETSTDDTDYNALHEHRGVDIVREQVRLRSTQNMSPLGGAYQVHGNRRVRSRMVGRDCQCRVKADDSEREAERELALMEKFDGLGTDVASILMSLEEGTVQSELQQGALQRGVGEGAGIVDMIEGDVGVGAATGSIGSKSCTC